MICPNGQIMRDKKSHDVQNNKQIAGAKLKGHSVKKIYEEHAQNRMHGSKTLAINLNNISNFNPNITMKWAWAIKMSVYFRKRVVLMVIVLSMLFK